MTFPLADLQRVLDPRLFWVTDKEIGPSSDRLHYANFAVVWRVITGEVRVETATGTWRGRPGDWLILHPGRRFQGFRTGSRIWSIAYGSNRTRGEVWYAGPDVIVLPRCPELEAASGGLIALTERISGQRPLGWLKLSEIHCSAPDWLELDAVFRLWMRSLIMVMAGLGVGLEAAQPLDPRIRLVLARLRQEPWSVASSPAALATEVGLSRRRLEQLFAAQLNRGLAEERTRSRIDAACEQLSRPEQRIKMIAQRLGFTSGAAFSVWFRRHAGVSPARFRTGRAG